MSLTTDTPVTRRSLSPLRINRDRLLHRLDQLAQVGAIYGAELWAMPENM
ncbi:MULTISPECIES: hypothetical protein [Cyanophyceae]|uniref:Uncharacterized protein n=1 Tax=Lyngbya confervoides BDU141951 TaxID=1574623 RepID=A0A8T6QL09_9CYAN|nr:MULTISPECIES: hypothetical protein [Cyanophyceae]MCM1983709.1 hypothetical protein [Lyngbya confervoides BDU141951]